MPIWGFSINRIKFRIYLKPYAWGHALVHDFMHEDSLSINLQHRPGFPSQTHDFMHEDSRSIYSQDRPGFPSQTK